MSEAPAKPARRRVARNSGGGDVGSSVDRSAEFERGNSRGYDREDNKPERENMGNGTKDGDRHGPGRERSVDFQEPPKSSAGSGQQTQSRAGSPMKPPKKFIKPQGGKGDLRPSLSEADEKDDVANRSTGRGPTQGLLNSMNSTLFGNFGYRLGSQQLLNPAPLPYAITGDKETVWALCVEIQSILADTTGLVKPAVKVHAVYRDSGMYVKSMRLPAAEPISTAHVTLDDHTASRPSWHESFLLAANFADVVTEDTVLLFELLDLRPSLRTTTGAAAQRQPKRVAWSYLLPVSEGKANVGICADWKVSSDLRGGAGRGRGGPGAANRGGMRDAAGSGSSSSESKDQQKEDKEETKDEAKPPTNRSKKLKLQLYESVDDDGMLGMMQRNIMGWPHPKSEVVNRLGKSSSYPDGIPSVYLQWRRYSYVPIEKGQLHVRVGPQETEFTSTGAGVTSTAVNKDGTPQRKSLDSNTGGMVQAEAELIREPKHFNRAKSFAIKRMRGPTEPCSVPDKLLHRLEVGPEGAMTVKYSHSGHLLAVAGKSMGKPAPFVGEVGTSTILGDAYALRLFDTDTGEQVWCQETAHHGVIYGISWSLDNSYLVTSSGDGTVKVWDINGLLPQNRESEGAAKDEEDVDMPYLLYSHVTSPPAYMYCAVFQEYAPAPRGSTGPNVVNNVQILEEYTVSKSRNPLPRVIAGGSDGRIRVWDGGSFKGYISVEDPEDQGENDSAPAAHNNARVHSLTIDSRSRYLLSGDSLGNLFVWRADSKNWYQLLRRFKQDAPPQDPETSAQTLMQSGGVQSLTMHPNKTKSQVLVLNQCPPHLKLYNTSTYRPMSTCVGLGGGQVTGKSKVSKNSVNTAGAVFGRAELSADGRYAIAGVSAQTNTGNDSHYNLKVWEAKLGNLYPAALSEISLPYPVRSISWHPSQHVVAVAMVGQGAAVAVYCGERQSSELAIGRMAEDALDEFSNKGGDEQQLAPIIEKK